MTLSLSEGTDVRRGSLDEAALEMASLCKSTARTR